MSGKSRSFENKELKIGDVITTIDPEKNNREKRCEYFNQIILLHELKLPRENKNGITPDFLNCESIYWCSSKNKLRERREILCKELIKSPTLSEIFNYHDDEPIIKLDQLWDKEKNKYPYISNYIDDIRKEKDYSEFVRWILLISCFSLFDKNDIFDFFKIIENFINKIDSKKRTPHVNNILDSWIEEKLIINDELINFNILSNHGLRWIQDQSRTPLFHKIIERSNKINILITEDRISEKFSKFARNPNNQYTSETSLVHDIWNNFMNKLDSNSQSKIKFKTSPIPLLRQHTEFTFQNSNNSELIVVFYTYGAASFNENHFLKIGFNNPYFNLYHNEFKYLFNNDFKSLKDPNLFPVEHEIADKINHLSDSDKQMILNIIDRLS